jgi:hypothetical protein
MRSNNFETSLGNSQHSYGSLERNFLISWYWTEITIFKFTWQVPHYKTKKSNLLLKIAYYNLKFDIFSFTGCRL